MTACLSCVLSVLELVRLGFRVLPPNCHRDRIGSKDVDAGAVETQSHLGAKLELGLNLSAQNDSCPCPPDTSLKGSWKPTMVMFLKYG